MALLEAAAHVFAESGFEAASTRDIVTAAGLQQGALYHYYPGGKPELAEHVVELGFHMYAAPGSEPTHPNGLYLQMVVDASIALGYRTPRDKFAQAAARLATDQDQRTFGVLWNAYIPRVTAILQQSSEHGELLQGVRPAETAITWVEAFVGADLRYRKRLAEMPEAISRLNQTIVRGIATPETLVLLDASVERGALLYELEEEARVASDSTETVA
ncbi:helix-turn-helix domain-containing protein [Streptomyces monashensis]|uniref:helix-turn-helix domain-containing protein n=1 Tax=Streptomyces monashensis TaxID=1678012 RepID=UPI0033EF789F